MKKSDLVFTSILATGLVVGVGLMLTNSKLFNEITGVEEVMPTIQQEQAQTGQPAGKETVTGIVIAGTTTPYLEFTQAGYDIALKDKKVVVLNFYATWCPICRAELPDVKSAFDSLNRRDVVGFQVNYNDPDTDADEKALAKLYGVTYQHTKVILVDGKQVLKETAQWDKEMFVTQINAASEK